MPKPGEVVIVSGPPGSGKTTVAAALAGGVELGVHLESDWFYRSIRAGFIAPHLAESRSQNIAVTDVATDAAATYALAGYAVVWDGVVGPWFVERVARKLASRGVSLRYVVVRPGREVALERVRRRDGTIADSGVATMFDQFAELGELERHVVDSSATPSVVLAACLDALASDASRVQFGAWVDDQWAVSVKGVLGWDGRYVVLRNRRDEWELPGGRLDAGDVDPVSALRREMSEELGLDVEVGDPIDSWIYDVEGKRVLILTYRCHAPRPRAMKISSEHTEVGQFRIDELEQEVIPVGYVRSLRTAESR